MERKVVLRAVEPEDLDILYRYENNQDLWAVGSTLAPYSRKQIHDYVAAYSADIFAERQLRLMITDVENGQTVGTVDLTDFSPADMRAQVGIMIDEPYQRMGYGTAALQQLVTYARDILQLHQLYAMVPEGNSASMRLFKSIGFSTSGRLRSWLRRQGAFADVIILQMLFP